MTVDVRPYDPAADAGALYDRKLAFERGLGESTGGEGKAAAYEGKLTDEYRERWLAWVERCTDDDERCVTVAIDGKRTAGSNDDSGSNTDRGGDSGSNTDRDGDSGSDLVGYVFVLPERLAMIWDAAVINELYVAPDHRGAGVADELMRAAIDIAADQDLPLDRIVLDVDPANGRAKAFYNRHGFETWGEMVARPVETE
ncbi:GNAT family N-acetyltransferase [Halorubrum trueperi]|uniref:GNAT family N-acetyltransferase n=1 Tax=Halorubrum trueperi TaxID=2004704 RepID=A0ABD5UMI2_9EURY